MHCEEIREHFIELIYGETGDSPAIPEAHEHLRTCSACRQELAELTQTREYLRYWKDESPPSNLVIAGSGAGMRRKFNWRYLRYAAIAAMLVLCFLALTNAQISLNRDGFSFRTQLFGESGSEGNYYTKSEVRDIMKRALDDSEVRMNESSYLMMQKMMDIVEQDRWNDLRHIRNLDASIRNRN